MEDLDEQTGSLGQLYIKIHPLIRRGSYESRKEKFLGLASCIRSDSVYGVTCTCEWDGHNNATHSSAGLCVGEIIPSSPLTPNRSSQPMPLSKSYLRFPPRRVKAVYMPLYSKAVCRQRRVDETSTRTLGTREEGGGLEHPNDSSWHVHF